MSNKKIVDIVTNIETIFRDVYPNELKKLTIDKFGSYDDKQLETCFDSIIESFVPTGKVPLPLVPHYTHAIKLSCNNVGIEDKIITYKSRYLDIKTRKVSDFVSDIINMCNSSNSENKGKEGKNINDYYVKIGVVDINTLVQYQTKNPDYPVIGALWYERFLARAEDRTPLGIQKMMNNIPVKEAVEDLIIRKYGSPKS